MRAIDSSMWMSMLDSSAAPRMSSSFFTVSRPGVGWCSRGPGGMRAQALGLDKHPVLRMGCCKALPAPPPPEKQPHPPLAPTNVLNLGHVVVHQRDVHLVGLLHAPRGHHKVVRHSKLDGVVEAAEAVGRPHEEAERRAAALQQRLGGVGDGEVGQRGRAVLEPDLAAGGGGGVGWWGGCVGGGLVWVGGPRGLPGGGGARRRVGGEAGPRIGRPRQPRARRGHPRAAAPAPSGARRPCCRRRRPSSP
jgi:hypothetical protein